MPPTITDFSFPRRPEPSEGHTSDAPTPADLGMNLTTHVIPADISRGSTAHDDTNVDFWWKYNPVSGDFIFVDLIVHARPIPSGTQASAQPLQPVSSPSPLDRVLGSVGAAHVAAFKLVFPATSGHVVASSFLEQRLVGCPLVRDVQGFLKPLSKYEAPDAAFFGRHSLLDWAEGCGGLVELETANITQLSEALVLLVGLDGELSARLNTPWVIAGPLERKRVALVRGRPDIKIGGPVYRAVASLGMDLVVIDEPGHWLQPDTPENRLLREAFLATDMTEDDGGIVDRIAESISDYPLPIHGIFTLSDNFFVAVAEVATRYGLPTSPVRALQTSTDKYRSRTASYDASADQFARVTGVDDLENLLAGKQIEHSGSPRGPFVPRFPMVVKPAKGWGSECVSKVNSVEDMTEAVARACARHRDRRACVIEPFFDGPEVDVNFVMVDGEILFSEIADESPCDADPAAAGVSDTFSPVGLMLPSVLPHDEQERALGSLRDTLIAIGFRTGVFHVEARMVHSKAEYRCVDGVVDLVPKPDDVAGPGPGPGHDHVYGPRPDPRPSCKLLEINARPPGCRVTLATRHAYGVDYFQAHALAAVGDRARLVALCRPFQFPPAVVGGRRLLVRHPHAHCWSQFVYLPAPGTGVVRSEGGACAAMLARRPDLAAHVAFFDDYVCQGDLVEEFTHGSRTYVGHPGLLPRQQETGDGDCAGSEGGVSH